MKRQERSEQIGTALALAVLAGTLALGASWLS